MRLERLALDDFERLGGPVGSAAYVRGLVPAGDSVEGPVSEILARVAAEGDAAVLELTRRLDLAEQTEPRPLTVEPEALDAAIRTLPLDVVAGLQVAIANVAQVAEAGVEHDTTVNLPQGHSVTLREIPVGSAAVYVPGGRAPYPSTVVMGVVTARTAGVLDVAVCAPPGPDGEIDPVILGTCRLLGVERVHRMGGAQAIAALAYGTETVERVDVIVGPGNLYVQEAKRQLSGVVGIDGFAGPSDLLVILGEDADPAPIALDMLAQAEHGAGSLVAAISPSARALDALAERLDAVLAAATASTTPAEPASTSTPGESGSPQSGFPDPQPAGCVLIETPDTRAAVELANAFAPEHLQLVGAEPESLAPLVRSAGCVFVGPYAGTAFGDYVAGSNHILPTGGAARFSSGLSARDFRRRMSEVRLDAGAAAKLARAGAPIADAEGFSWHAESMRARIGEND